MKVIAIYLCTVQSFEIYMLIIQSSAGIFYHWTFLPIHLIGKILKLHQRTRVANTLQKIPISTQMLIIGRHVFDEIQLLDTRQSKGVISRYST